MPIPGLNVGRVGGAPLPAGSRRPGERVLLKSQIANGHTAVDFVGMFSKAYDHYIFVFLGLYASAAADIELVVSINGGSSYIGTGIYAFSYTEFSGSAALTGAQSTAGSKFRVATVGGSGVARSVNGALDFFIHTTTYASISGAVSRDEGKNAIIGGIINASGRVNAARFTPSTGTLTGTINMLGVVK